MTKDDKGVWSITVGPLTPDFYSYTFNVDGVRTVDPKNPMIKQGISSLDSMFLVPGDEAEFETTKDVPHGEVRAAWYRSGTLDACGACTSTRRPATRAARESTRSSTCSTAAATRTRAGARSAGPASSSTTCSPRRRPCR